MQSLRVLSKRELNRTVLQRQLLLKRSQDSVPEVLEQMGGLQAQYAPSSYIGLWSRRAGMERAALDLALEDRSVIQGTLMRVTIHLVSRQDYWPFAAALRRTRQQMWLRLLKGRRTAGDIEALADRTRELLAAGPRKRRDLLKALGDPDNGTWIGVGLWVDLVRVPPSGTWQRRRADLYALAESWVGPQQGSEPAGIDRLVRRYLAAFGPGSMADLGSWTGLPASLLSPRLEAMDTIRYLDPLGKDLFDLPELGIASPDTPAPVRFLPTWDAALLVHCRRAGILPEVHRPKVFHIKIPQSVGTFLVDGRVAGTWKPDKRRVLASSFEPLDPAVARELKEEAERLEEFMA